MPKFVNVTDMPCDSIGARDVLSKSSRSTERTGSGLSSLSGRVLLENRCRCWLHGVHRVRWVWGLSGRCGGSRLVGPDVGLETVLVGRVLDRSEDSVSIDVRVGSSDCSAV